MGVLTMDVIDETQLNQSCGALKGVICNFGKALSLFSLSNLIVSALILSLASILDLICFRLIFVSSIQFRTTISVVVLSSFRKFILSNVELTSTRLLLNSFSILL